jgi:ubiquinone/menaquinone biosynthesis C-methylase UbiE
LRDTSIDAYVSNLPFGQRFVVDGEMAHWLRAVLGEAARVTRPGGRVVVLAPSVPRGAVPPSLVPAGRIAIRLLGTRTAIRAYDRGSP